MTYQDFKENNENKGESVMQLAAFAQLIEDDPELKRLGEEAIRAEQRFEYALEDRRFNRG